MSRPRNQRRGAWLALLALACSLLLPSLAGAVAARAPVDAVFGPVCTSGAADADGPRDEAPSAPAVHHAGQPACGCAPCAPAAAPGPAATPAPAVAVGFLRLPATADGQARRPGVQPPLPARGPPAR